MTIVFTEEEKKYLVFDDSKEYRMSCSKDAPKKIADRINKKIKEHKEWIEYAFRKKE